MDMWKSYAKTVRLYYRGFALVYNVFHILANYSRTLNEIRVDEYNRLEGSQEGRLIKGSRYLLLKGQEKLSSPAQEKLMHLLCINRSIYIAYILKEKLRKLWKQPSRQQAKRFLYDLYAFMEKDVKKLHKEAIVWDCHNDLEYRVLYEGLDIGERLPGGHVDIKRLKEGGVDVQVVALFIQNYLYPDKSAWQTFKLLRAMKKAIDKNSDSVELARTGSDVERIVSEGKIALPLAIERDHAIEDSLELLRKFHELGVSFLTLTHNVSHGWADSSKGPPKWNGLNELGHKVIKEMNRIGMVIDVSYVSDKTFYDVIKISENCWGRSCRSWSRYVSTYPFTCGNPWSP